VQLFINVPEVGANGVDADVELVADLLVRPTPGLDNSTPPVRAP